MSVEPGSKTCPFCAETVKVAAQKCRFCGSDLSGEPAKMRPAVGPAMSAAPIQVNVVRKGGGFMGLIKNLVMLMTFGILATVVGTCAMCGKAVSDVAVEHREAKVEETRAVANDTPIEVTADVLDRAYDDNVVAADAAYKGRVLLVSGTVSRIDTDFSNDPVVILKSRTTLGGVRCSFDGGKEAVAQLRRGAKVVLAGVGHGEIIGSPQLKRCVVR